MLNARRMPALSVLLTFAFVSVALPAQESAPSLESELAAELAKTPLPHSMTLQAGILRLRPGKERVACRILLQIPWSELAKGKHPHDGAVSAECAFYARVVDSQGNRSAEFCRLVSGKRSLRDLKAEASASVSLSVDAQLLPGSYTLEAVGRDQMTGQAVARKLDFSVPVVEDGVALSSLMLLGRTEPVALGHLNPSDDLQFHGKKIIPDFSGVVRKRRDGEVRFYMIIYPQPDAPYEPQLGIEFSRDGRIAGATQPRLPERNDRGNIAFIIEFATKQFKPGNYVARAVVRQGDSQAESSVNFRVEAGE